MKTVEGIIDFLKERKETAKQLLDEASARYEESHSAISRSSADGFLSQYNVLEECLAWIEGRPETPLF